MLFQLNPSSSMIINRARLTSAAGETRDRVNDTNARRSSLVRLKTDCMLHIVLLKSMLHNTSLTGRLSRNKKENINFTTKDTKSTKFMIKNIRSLCGLHDLLRKVGGDVAVLDFVIPACF